MTCRHQLASTRDCKTEVACPSMSPTTERDVLPNSAAKRDDGKAGNCQPRTHHTGPAGGAKLVEKMIVERSKTYKVLWVAKVFMPQFVFLAADH